MSKPWFRWYRDTCEDGKFRIVVRNVNVTARNGSVTVTVRDVLALWAFILEDASRMEHRGVCERSVADMCAILDFDSDTVIHQILESMELASLIMNEHGCIRVWNWNKRQFESDTKDNTNSDRQQRYRKRHRNGIVTEPKRPDTDTDTEKKKTGANAPYAFVGRVIKLTQGDFDQWAVCFPNVDLRAYLEARDIFLFDLPSDDNRRARWMVSTSSDLRNKNSAPKTLVSSSHKPTYTGKLADFKPEKEVKISEEEKKRRLTKANELKKLIRMTAEGTTK